MITHSGGVCVMGYGEGRGTHRVDEAVQMVRNNPVLGRDDVLRKAGGLLVGITGGPRLSLSEVEQIMSAVTEVSHPDVHLFMGAAVNDAWDDRVGIAVLAAEAWVDEAERAADDEEAEGEQAGAGGGGASESPRAAHAGGKRKRRKSVQTSLSIGPSGRGRFNDVEPTIVQGEDLDAPTFLRRGVKLVR
jgi:cell division protein FtsZ